MSAGGFLVAGAVAFAVELGVCLSRGSHWFLRGYEPLVVALAALWLPAAFGLLGLGLSRARCGRRGRGAWPWAVAVPMGALGLWAGVALTAGRWAQTWAWRWPLTVALALALACAPWLTSVAMRVSSASEARRRGAALLAVVVGAAFGAVDAGVLPRSYPAFHALASLGALWCFVCAGALWRVAWPAARLRISIGALALLATAGLGLLARSYNAGHVARMAAPWTGKLLTGVERWVAEPAAPLAADGAPDPTANASRSVARGVDLRDVDVLLITVDALRADALGAYGGSVGTPAMDALAAEGLVFERAYTPTPHTSYALSSMLTGKPLREVMALHEGPSDHRTLPESLRRFGYRTAAFFPPAIFFVDGARFARLSDRNFGFEYLKRMYAPARQRVAQVRAYLREVRAGKPVFVWVHLFEPHEPYDAPEGEPASERPRHRYDAEVRYVDRAVGELVAMFRAERPGAVVILSADHGEEFSEHGGLYHGTTLYDEQARIPLIWSAPGRIAQGRSPAPVELYDLATTVLAAAGVARDARMRGDDLGELLRGGGAGPAYAFASIEGLSMVTDGRHKALCEGVGSRCRLFDLEADPHERDNLAGREPAVLSRLQRALASHLGSIARVEALPVAEGVGFPEALSRARLGDPAAAAALVPLLSADAPELRASVARTLGELRYEGARVVLTRLRTQDEDAAVRREAALASCALGEAEGCDAAVAALAEAGDDLALARRTAGVLADAGRSEGAPVLIGWLTDTHAEEAERIEALARLRALRASAAEPALIALLADVRLRPLAAEALGELGSPKAADALARQLAEERYPPARAAEAGALLALGDARVVPLLVRMLGTDSGVPGGVRLLVDAGALRARPSRLGTRLVANNPALLGSWQCADSPPGCRPGEGARVRLPGPQAGAVRVSFWTHAEAPTTLEVSGHSLPVPAGEGQVGLGLEAPVPETLALGSTGEVALRALVVAPRREDIAPPAPEPWGEDVEEGASAR